MGLQAQVAANDDIASCKESTPTADTSCVTVPNDNRSHYDILHVSRDAPLEIIRGTYRTMMQKLKHHPDLGGDTSTAALINEAYAVLTNENKRAEYDAQLDLATEEALDSPPDQESSAQQESPRQEEPPPAPKQILDPSRQCTFCAMPHNLGSVINVDATCTQCGSPLTEAESHRPESVGQRAIARINKRQQLTFYTHWSQAKGYFGRTEDISLSGLRFLSDENLRQGQHIKLVCNVLEAVATVTHCRTQRHGWKTECTAGVSYITIRYAKSIGGFISARV